MAHPSVLLIDNFLTAAGQNPSPTALLAARLTAAGWAVRTTSRHANRLLRLADMVGTVWRQRRHYAVAVVAVYSGPAFFWATAVCAALRAAGKPYILTLHGGNLPAFAQAQPGRVRALLAGAAAVTAPSPYLRVALQPYRADIRLVPNPLDLAAYPFRLRPTPGPQLVWLRAFHAIYNPTLAPAVLAALAADFPAVRLTMIGPDKDGSLAAVRATAAQLGVADRVALPGAVAKAAVPGWLDQGDIFLNTTNVDNTPVSVLEALACGLPVVSTAVGGIPYLLTDGGDALLVPPADAAAMAAAVRRLWTEAGLAHRLAVGGRRTVAACDWGAVLPQWEALLTAVAAGAVPAVAAAVMGGEATNGTL
ncbi:MAG: glycosyltransferase family 4 protein [Chloroflexota bacterium]|nr:glycosyltransferase family 4 protein [Chloroflexota bacterium]